MEKNPFQVLQDRRARLAISQTYSDRVDHQDPDRQDQLDKNRVPGAIDNEKDSGEPAERDDEE